MEVLALGSAAPGHTVAMIVKSTDEASSNKIVLDGAQ